MVNVSSRQGPQIAEINQETTKETTLVVVDPEKRQSESIVFKSLTSRLENQISPMKLA